MNARVFFISALVLAAAAPAHAAVQPYGTNDAGGFRNVLPPGSAGNDNALQLAAFQAAGTRPAHWDDQLPLYTDLLYASPTLTHDDVAKYFKDATFGVKPEDVESTQTPRPGVIIVRDKQYGVPHIYGETDEDVEFGAGYAGAQDRLFLMDVLRHYARGQLSSFAGGDPGNRQLDRDQWSVAPYTEADLQKQIDLAPTVYGDLGTQMVKRLNAFVDGVNAYISEVQTNPLKMPAEYAALHQQLQPWKATDTIAEASLIGGIFGKGGGQEVRSAQLLTAMEQRFGKRRGRRSWRDLREKNDPEAPTTVLKRRFPYETGSPFARRGLALPDPGSVTFAPVAPPLPSASRSTGSIGGRLGNAMRKRPLMSNWELVSARESATGHPIGVLGPQVGYYVPQILVEQDLHGPHFDARGAAFPGVNLMVQLGHGRDYAWSATTATSDNIDTFAEVLCQDDSHYLYKGQCLAMEKLESKNSWIPNASDTTPPGSETLTAWRTVHGIVYARGTVGGKAVAFVQSRTTYFHEADSAIGFFRLNDPSFVRDPQSFRQAIGGINFLFNWAYIDADHIAYQLSGWLPKKARGVSSDFPVLGTGEYDWRNWNAELHTEDTFALDKRPHTVDQKYLVSWNNKQAPGFAAADDVLSYGSLYRSQLIEDRVKAGIAGAKKMTIEQLVQAMEEPASEDIRGVKLVPILRKAMGRLTDPRLQAAMDTLTSWSASRGHRRDLDKNGKDDDEDAIQIMDAWWPPLVQAEFGPVLGDEVMAAAKAMNTFPQLAGEGTEPDAPAFSDGWWSLVHKDLRDLFNRRKPRGHFSRVYCGAGRKARCRTALRDSLAAALDVTKEQLYAHGKCAGTPTSACWDMNRSTVAVGIGIDPFPFQNRPTFQQTVEVTQHAPR